MSKNMGRPKITTPPSCCPDKLRYCKDLCQKCYNARYCRTDKFYKKAKDKRATTEWKSYMKAYRKIYASYPNYKEWRKVHDFKYNKTDKAVACRKRYAKKYPERNRHRVRLREISKLQRTPKWADLSKIREFYFKCPRGLEVDHIIPLRGSIVSGLHIIDNLQYLSPQENKKKGNKFNV